jgi:two-component system NarL family sensor kinase
LALIAVAWVAPLAWLALALHADASDGTVVSSPTAVLGAGRWGESVTVLDTYGDTPLRAGDHVLSIGGRSPAEWLAQEAGVDHSAGEVIPYRIRRPGTTLDRIQEVDVPLTRYPLGAALADNLDRVVLVLGLLTAGSFLLLRRAREPLALATLALGSATAAGMSAHPFGPQAIELTTSRGLWSHVAGDLLLTVGLGALLVLAWSFPHPPARLAERRKWWLLLIPVPFAGYAAWVLGYALRQPEPARLQALLTISLPALGTTLVIVVLAAASGYLRAVTPEERVAVRLMVLAALATVVVRVVLDDAPQLLRGQPLVPWDVLALVLVPMVLACWVAAVLGYRLLEIDATLRRSLLQVVLATLVGAVFLAAAGAVNVASGTSVRSLVTGGVVALILLPAALVLRRTVSRLVYGDRAFPYRVVSELRRLDPRAGPDDALEETLARLSRSLRLSYASIEAVGSSSEDRLVISLGERRGDPTTVLLEVAGTPLGRLDMEVSPMRDPFGPRDRRLLEDVGTQVGALVQALVANRELQRARERLIAAREEERRRLRRDLHDGLGPSLATLLMKLEVAKDLITHDPEGASELVSQITDQTESDIGEIRRLVDGLRPPALDQLGLVSALRQRADEYNHAAALGRSRSPLTWSVVADDVGALPAAVEVAAYRIAVEAVNNAVRHSRGSVCAVTLRRDRDALEVEIRDDGSGVADVPGTGVGVGSMRERAEELGGTCTVSSAPGRGTVVLAHLPLTTTVLGDENRTS